MSKNRVLLNCLGVQSHEHPVKNVFKGCSNGGWALSIDEIQELCGTYRKRLTMDEEEFSSTELNKHRKRFRVSIDAVQINEFVKQFDNNANVTPTENLHWEALKSLIHAGRVSIQMHPYLLESAKLAGRLEVLAESIKSVFDVSVSDIYDIILFATKVDITSLKQYHLVGNSLVSDYTLRDMENFHMKKRKELSLCDILRVLVDCALQRSTAYTLVEISEASKQLPLEVASVLLRLLAFIIRSDNSISSSFISKRYCEVTERASTWISGILDAQVGNLILVAQHSSDHRQLFESIIKSIEYAKDHITNAEAALNYTTQIRRYCASSEKRFSQNQSGIYEIEELEL